ncbi:MAG: sulfite exporter TauE/SafE family protein [Spirochaetaceae bacterium]|nr:sulfite exporter TauE/SafE family protein [Spirochaetaceae bacterium]MCF7947355.1 sulfite exporter TauE/SafE family protein [Spirochaetia bacterium]MCF7952182.1 sulfite exporter TauE/SafE family protein [Spirochaetaceae bacterium]
MDWQQLIRVITPTMDSSLSGLPFYAALLAVGLGIGVLTGFFGVGGGFLVVPILNVLLGINYEIAVGSSLSFIIGTSFAGLVKQRKLGNVHFRVAGYIIIGSVLGAVLGDSLQMFLLYGLAGGNTEMFTLFMHSIFIVVLIGTIFAMRTPGESETPRLPLLARVGPAPRFQIEEWGSHGFSVPGSFLVGVLIGVFTGLLGIGGGVMLVPVLLGLYGLSHQKAAGTSLAIIFATSVAAVIKKSFSDVPKISLPLTIILLVASLLGVQVGIFLVRRISGAGFRRYFIYVLLATIAMIAFDLVGTLL